LPTTEPPATEEARDWRVVITSPGTVDMQAITSLATALKRPVGHLAKMVYSAPTVLLHGIAAEQATQIRDGCEELGLEAIAEIGDDETGAEPDRFDVAVHVTDLGALGHAVETVSRVVGVGPEQAYQMLATPPGLLLGQVSRAAVGALDERFGPGVDLRVCQSGTGPFDLYLSPDSPTTPELTRLCGSQRGLVTLGLAHAEAKRLATRLPKGSAQIVARDLVRFDLVLDGVDLPTPVGDRSIGPNSQTPAAWVSATCGVDESRFDVLLNHTPIAVKEGLDHQRAEQLAAEGAATGLRLTVAPAGFDRYGVTVVTAEDPVALGDLVRRMEIEAPTRYPATVADGLSDLEARCLATQLELVGAVVSYEES
jgi:hypothetical protein